MISEKIIKKLKPKVYQITPDQIDIQGEDLWVLGISTDQLSKVLHKYNAYDKFYATKEFGELRLLQCEDESFYSFYNLIRAIRRIL